MGTRSFVGAMVNNRIRAVYVHWDGYLEGVGAELQAYKTQETVEELISHGDRSSLDGPYYKDRGETNADPQDYDTFEEFCESCEHAGGEYYYLFKNGIWYCGDIYGYTPISHKLVPYSDAKVI